MERLDQSRPHIHHDKLETKVIMLCLYYFVKMFNDYIAFPTYGNVRRYIYRWILRFIFFRVHLNNDVMIIHSFMCTFTTDTPYVDHHELVSTVTWKDPKEDNLSSINNKVTSISSNFR